MLSIQRIWIEIDLFLKTISWNQILKESVDILKAVMRWLKLKKMILQDSNMLYLRQNLKSKSRGKITKWSSTREIFLELNWSRGTKNLLCSMRRLRFKLQLFRKERLTIKREFKIFLTFRDKLLKSRENLLFLKTKLLAFLTWRERLISWRKNTWNNNKRRNSLMMNFKSQWTFIDGGSLIVLTQKPMKWFKKFNHYRKDW